MKKTKIDLSGIKCYIVINKEKNKYGLHTFEYLLTEPMINKYLKKDIIKIKYPKNNLVYRDVYGFLWDKDCIKFLN